MVKENRQVSSFWSIFFAIISLCAIALAVFYFVTLSADIDRIEATTVDDDNYYKISLENSISDNMYSSIDSLSAIDTQLAKLSVTLDREMQHALLQDVATTASSLAVSMGHLPLTDSDNKYAIEQYINGLYSASSNLCDYVAGGGTLTAEHQGMLLELRVVAQYLYAEFNDMALEGGTLPITNSMYSDGSNVIDDTVLDIDNDVICRGCDATQMYQCADNCSNIEMGELIDEQGAKDIATTLLRDYHGITIEGVSVQNSVSNSSQYYYISAISDDTSAYVILTLDGRVAQVDTSSQWVGQPIDDATTVAEQYCNMLGYQVTAVGMPRIEGSIHYITLCPQVEGVVIYPDMVKVAVDTSSGAVIAFDGMSYLANNTDRQLEWGDITIDDVMTGIAEDATVHATNRALIQCDGCEICCHELAIGRGDDMYLLHVDSHTGEHVHMQHLTSHSSVIER